MKDLIKKYEELFKEEEYKLFHHSDIYTDEQIKIIETKKALLIDILDELKNNRCLDFENNERILLKRLVTNEIETPRKKYGTSKMNTLFTLQEKLKK